MSGWHELADELHTEWTAYGHETRNGRAHIRTRSGASGIRLHLGTNSDGARTVTVYIDNGKTHAKAKVLLTDFQDALNTAIRTSDD